MGVKQKFVVGVDDSLLCLGEDRCFLAGIAFWQIEPSEKLSVLVANDEASLLSGFFAHFVPSQVSHCQALEAEGALGLRAGKLENNRRRRGRRLKKTGKQPTMGRLTKRRFRTQTSRRMTIS